MPFSDEEVFARFRGDATLTREQAHLAYAAYAEAKYDWFEHVRQQTGSPPTLQQVEDWIAALPDSRFNELRLTSFAFFEEAAEAYMLDQIEAAKGEAVNESILNEVQRLNRDLSSKVETAISPWTAWKIGIGSGLLGSFLFVVIVAVSNWLFTSDPSPFALLKALVNHGPSASVPAPGAPPH